MTNESDLVPLHMHNLLTAGPAPWTDTRVPSEVWHVARAVYGTSTEDDEKRVYRTLQAALWKLAAHQPEAQPRRDAGERMQEGMQAFAQRFFHTYWGAGEPGCPEEIKAPNGELFKLRCKKCGEDNPRRPWCPVDDAAPSAQAPQCTCPSGDGSLRWPCPVHPPSAQAELRWVSVTEQAMQAAAELAQGSGS